MPPQSAESCPSFHLHNSNSLHLNQWVDPCDDGKLAVELVLLVGINRQIRQNLQSSATCAVFQGSPPIFFPLEHGVYSPPPQATVITPHTWTHQCSTFHVSSRTCSQLVWSECIVPHYIYCVRWAATTSPQLPSQCLDSLQASYICPSLPSL